MVKYSYMERFTKKTKRKYEMAKGVDFLQSLLKIKYKIILKQLKDIPLIDTDSNIVRVLLIT